MDSLIRKKIHRLNSDHRKTFTTFSSALLEALTNHKQLWNDARSSAELDKFKQASQQAPETPPKRAKRDRSVTPNRPSPKAKKNKARREWQKKLVAAARDHLGSKKTEAPKKDARVPPHEWAKITSFKYTGKRRCPWYNCSLGCRFGDQCKSAHVCVECGKDHPCHGNH